MDTPVISTESLVQGAARTPASHQRGASARRTGRPALHYGIFAACAAAVAAIAVAVWSYSRTGSHVAYSTEPATRGTVAPYVTASGTVNPVVTIQVGTYVSGVIQELFCDFNTQVHRNQLCAKIDPRPYQTVVDQDKANLASARAQLEKDQTGLELARVIYERYRGLFEKDSLSRESLDNAYSTWRQADSQVALDRAVIGQHEAALKSAQVNLGYTDIVSPVDGTVVSRNVTQGQTVAASFQTPTLFVIATDLTRMQVDASVSESDIGEVRPGNESSFTVEAFPNHIFHGRVVQVRQSPQTVQNVVTYDVVVDAANPDLLLKPGMTAAARIVTRRHDNVLRVPDQALRYSPAALTGPASPASASPHVWVLRGGKPQPVVVTPGLNDDAYAEIAEGELRPGDQIIVSERAPNNVPTAPGQMVPRAPRL